MFGFFVAVKSTIQKSVKITISLLRVVLLYALKKRIMNRYYKY